MISILVVDDEEGIREYLADALEDEGRTIVQAADGVEALGLSLIHISEPTRPPVASRMPSSA